MAIQNYPKRWTNKPPVGTQINRGHPLTYGMVGCWLFNEEGGFVQNLVSGVLANVSNYASPNWVVNLPGIVWNNPNAGALGNTYSQLMNPVLFPMTIVGIILFSNLSTQSGGMILSHSSTDDATTGYRLDFTAAAIPIMRLHLNGISDNNFSNLTISVANTFYFSAVTVDKNAGTANGYLGFLGSPLTAQAISGFGSLAAGTITTTFLLDSPNGPPVAPGQCSEILFYNRVLTSGEINWLNADPYAFMMPMSPARRQNKQLTAAAGGVTTPLRMRTGMGV
jgi:hypothetical protein